MSLPPLNPGPCAKQRDGEHCWHPTGEVFTSYPPQFAERCCECGNFRRRRASHGSDDHGHGPFTPGKPEPAPRCRWCGADIDVGSPAFCTAREVLAPCEPTRESGG